MTKELKLYKAESVKSTELMKLSATSTKVLKAKEIKFRGLKEAHDLLSGY